MGSEVSTWDMRCGHQDWLAEILSIKSSDFREMNDGVGCWGMNDGVGCRGPVPLRAPF